MITVGEGQKSNCMWEEQFLKNIFTSPIWFKRISVAVIQGRAGPSIIMVTPIWIEAPVFSPPSSAGLSTCRFKTILNTNSFSTTNFGGTINIGGPWLQPSQLPLSPPLRGPKAAPYFLSAETPLYTTSTINARWLITHPVHWQLKYVYSYYNSASFPQQGENTAQKEVRCGKPW